MDPGGHEAKPRCKLHFSIEQNEARTGKREKFWDRVLLRLRGFPFGALNVERFAGELEGAANVVEVKVTQHHSVDVLGRDSVVFAEGRSQVATRGRVEPI